MFTNMWRQKSEITLSSRIFLVEKKNKNKKPNQIKTKKQQQKPKTNNQAKEHKHLI